MSRANHFLIRIVLGACAGLVLGLVQVGWDERTWPVVVEYGLVCGCMAFALTNYMEFRRKLLARVKAETARPPLEGQPIGYNGGRRNKKGKR